MKSIRGKLWLSMMGLVGAIILLLWLLQIVFLENFYAQMRLRDVRSQLQSAAQLLQQSDPSAAANELDRLASTQNLTIEWLDADGHTVWISTPDASGQMPMMWNMLRGQLAEAALGGESVQTTIAHPRFDAEYSVLGMPLLTSAGRAGGALLASWPLAAVAETAAILKRQLVYVTGILLVVTSLLSFGLARGLTRPILSIRQVSEAIAAGDFSVRTAYRSDDEVGDLAVTINHLGEQLGKIEQLRRDLVAGVSHELRTPLAVIRGYAETIRDISGDQPEQRAEQVAIIIDETERLTSLINDNLQLALLQSGNAELQLQTFSLTDLLQETVDRYTVIANQRAISICLAAPEQITITADPAKLEQVVRNLLQNSLQHTPAGGRVNLELQPQGQLVRVVVQDNGSGIAPEELPFVWDKYYRGTASGLQPRGTGIGMAIVKAILEAHQAEFGIESALGVGTRVWFELKRASA